MSEIVEKPMRILDTVERHADKLGAVYGLVATAKEQGNSGGVINEITYDFFTRPFTVKGALHAPDLPEFVDRCIGTGVGSKTFMSEIGIAAVSWIIGECGLDRRVTKVAKATTKAMKAALVVSGFYNFVQSCTHSGPGDYRGSTLGTVTQTMGISGSTLHSQPPTFGNPVSQLALTSGGGHTQGGIGLVKGF